MKMELRQAPMLEMGTMEVLAHMQEPEPTISRSPNDLPTLHIEEAGITVELEFLDNEQIRRFRDRVNLLDIPDDDEDET